MTKFINKFSVGCDPEYFLTDGKRNVSAIGLIGGTKENPLRTEHGYVQEDNVGAEINTHPATSAEEFAAYVKAVFGDLEIRAKAHGLSISKDVFSVFSEEELKHPHALRSGCDPDYNAWDICMNEPPRYENMNTRAVGGHIHVGINKSSFDWMIRFIRTLDLFIAVPLIPFENNDRKKLYGKAGCFREKDYGVEYRTPSNLWTFNDVTVKWVYNSVDAALNFMQKEIEIPLAVRTAINRGDTTFTRAAIKKYDLIPYPA